MDCAFLDHRLVFTTVRETITDNLGAYAEAPRDYPERFSRGKRVGIGYVMRLDPQTPVADLFEKVRNTAGRVIFFLEDSAILSRDF